jgi:hypothetical protein
MTALPFRRNAVEVLENYHATSAVQTRLPSSPERVVELDVQGISPPLAHA